MNAILDKGTILSRLGLIPPELKAVPHFCLWRLEQRDGKQTKVPYQINGQLAKSNDHTTWSLLPCALQKVNGHYSGIGFQAGVEPCGFILIDLDHCIVDGEILPWALDIVIATNSYTELSPSGQGIHIFCGGKLPGASIKTVSAEIYDHLRYFTVTGNILDERSTYRQLSNAEIALIYEMVKATKPNRVEPKAAPQNTSIPVSHLTNSDLLEKMFRSKNGAAIQRLYNGDTTAHGDDSSSADLALCSHLAFWTSKNSATMDTLFRQSKLYRDKWDIKHSSDNSTYGEMTIQKAIAGCKEAYCERSNSTK